MDRFVARQNVEHFRDMLNKEQDKLRRERLTQLLLEEEAKLAEAEADHEPDRHHK